MYRRVGDFLSQCAPDPSQRRVVVEHDVASVPADAKLMPERIEVGLLRMCAEAFAEVLEDRLSDGGVRAAEDLRLRPGTRSDPSLGHDGA